MSDPIKVLVPDIGDFADVEIIEVLVADGDSVEAEQPLITLESDKASMDVPAPSAGVVSGLRVSVGDRVSEGSHIMDLVAAGAAGADDGDGADDDDDFLDIGGGGDEGALPIGIADEDESGEEPEKT